MESNQFLDRVRLLILQNLSNENFGVTELAEEIGLSTSQVLRKVKSINNQSINQLIRTIRLEEAKKLLVKNEEDNISEVAFQVGFSSPSYFIKCFHAAYGMTPGDYKKSQHKKMPVLALTSIGVVVILALIISFSFLSTNKKTSKNTTQEMRAIAVLPLLDLSPDKSMDYLAMGITDGITNELAKYENLRVISRGSASLYKDSVKLYKEIADQLQVDLLLEGSVMSTEAGLRVIVQLIRPHPQEKHVWSNKYHISPENLYYLSDEVSYKIAESINLSLSPEAEMLGKPRIEPQAYELYLRGQYLLDQQHPKAVSQAIDYAQQAITIDSSFTGPYTLLAEALIAENRFIRNNEEKLKNKQESQVIIQQALDRALQTNGDLGQVYVTYGYVLGRLDWDWDGMKRMVDKGLNLNPNQPKGYLLLSDYWAIKGDKMRSLEEAVKAYRLDPVNPKTGTLLAKKYETYRDYDSAIYYYQKVLDLHPNYGFALDGLGFARLLKGEKEQAKIAWVGLHEVMGNQEMAEYFKQASFNDGVTHWLAEATKTQELYCSNPSVIAMAYMISNEQEGAMKYLNYAYEYENEELPLTLIHPIFDSLRGFLPLENLTQKVGITQTRESF